MLSARRTAPVAAPSRRACVRVQAFKEPPTARTSATTLLTQVQTRALGSGNLYGKPLTKSEQAALEAVTSELQLQLERASNKEALQEDLLRYVQAAIETKKLPLNVVEGAMVVLEQLYLLDESPSVAPQDPAMLNAVLSEAEMARRWQLVIGADVGSIQYIPAVEELEVAPDGKSFNLDTDLDFLFTGFTGDARWLSAGHLQYHVRNVRIELRPPKAWQRADIWRRWRAQRGAHVNVPKSHADGEEPDYGMASPTARTCRPDPSRWAATLPLPFPANELFAYASNGQVMVVRSKLGGLIALVNKGPRIMGTEVVL